MSDRVTRRRYVFAVGTVGAVGLAGCVSDGTDDENDDGDDETPEATATETGDGTQPTSRLQVVSGVGTDISDGAIGNVELTVKAAPGSGEIDLSETTLEFVHSSGSTDLRFGSTGGSGSGDTFGVQSIQDAGETSLRGESPTLDDPADRAQLRLDTGSVVPSTGGLEEGDTATVRLNTKSGVTTEARLVVPETLAGAEAVDIYGSSESGTGEDTGTEDSDQVTNRLQVVSTVGTDISDGTIGSVEMVVKKAPGSGDIDLSTTTAQFVHASGSTDLTFGTTGGSGSATAFGVRSIQDEDGSLQGDSPVLNDPADRAQLRIDTGSIVPSTGGLEEGDSATVRFTTQSGATTDARLVVPETLSDAEAVTL